LRLQATADGAERPLQMKYRQWTALANLGQSVPPAQTNVG